jgi:predicted nucleic-acid-binding protein
MKKQIASKTYVLDTSFISSLLVIEDENNKEASGMFKELDSSARFLIPDTVILELQILPKSLRNTIYFDILGSFLSKDLFEFQPLTSEIVQKAIQINRTFDNKISAVDLSVLATTVLFSAELLTFDVALKKILKKVNK